MPKLKKPRVNKTKDELIAEQKHKAKIEKMAAIAKLMFPMIKNQEKIYDAQTVLFALSGYIEEGLKIKENELKVGDLGITLSKEPDTKISQSMKDILGLIKLENARDLVTLTKKMGDIIGQHGANEFCKGPMSNLKVTDIVK